MRPIKFRGKRLKIDDPLERWIEGTLAAWSDVQDRQHTCIVYKNGHHNDVNPETVSQFTGLLDKNGKEIYEGDIVSFTKYTGEVRWMPGKCCFQITPMGIFLSPKCKVIGNIYDKKKNNGED